MSAIVPRERASSDMLECLPRPIGDIAPRHSVARSAHAIGIGRTSNPIVLAVFKFDHKLEFRWTFNGKPPALSQDFVNKPCGLAGIALSRIGAQSSAATSCL